MNTEYHDAELRAQFLGLTGGANGTITLKRILLNGDALPSDASLEILGSHCTGGVNVDLEGSDYWLDLLGPTPKALRLAADLVQKHLPGGLTVVRHFPLHRAAQVDAVGDFIVDHLATDWKRIIGPYEGSPIKYRGGDGPSYLSIIRHYGDEEDRRVGVSIEVQLASTELRAAHRISQLDDIQCDTLLDLLIAATPLAVVDFGKLLGLRRKQRSSDLTDEAIAHVTACAGVALPFIEKVAQHPAFADARSAALVRVSSSFLFEGAEFDGGWAE